MTNKLLIQDWHMIDYKEAWDRQGSLQLELVNKKRNARKNGTNRANGYHYLVLCEHHPVYTLGKSGKEGHLLVGRDYLSDQGISFYKINRGGI